MEGKKKTGLSTYVAYKMILNDKCSNSELVFNNTL